MSVTSRVGRAAFLTGRLLFGGKLAYDAYQNITNMDGRIGYAESKDVPAADKLVPLSSYMLLLGSVGVVLWRLPRLAAAGVATFLAGVTPTMHDFWNMEDDRRESEKSNFTRNLAFLGAALAFFHLGRQDSRESSGRTDGE